MKKVLTKIFHNLTITKKLLLSYILILILPVLLFTLYFYSSISRSVLEQSELIMKANMEQVRTGIENRISVVERAESLLSSHRTLQSVMTGQYDSDYQQLYDYQFQVSSFIRNMLLQNEDFKNITIVSPRLIIRETADSYSSFRLFDAPDVFHFLSRDQFVARNGQWSQARPETLHPGRLAVMGAPLVMTYSGQLLNQSGHHSETYVAIDISERHLFHDLYASAATGIGSLYMTDPDGRIISNNQPDMFSRAMTEMGFSSFDHTKEHIVIENEALVISLPLHALNASLVGVFPVNLLLEDVRGSLPWSILLILAIVMLSCLLMILMTHLLFRRLHQMVGAMQQIRAGRLNVRLPDDSADEFGIMAGSFNHMASRLTELMDEVYQLGVMEREHELKALESYINPHFLYNTLATITWIARSHGAEEIVDTSQALSRFYRLVLSQGHSEIPIADEIEMVKAYMQIQKVRFEERFEISYDIDDAVTSLHMPKNILQPLIENALEHGIEPSRRPGHIMLRVRCVKADVLIEVQDDGVGMPDDIRFRLLTDKILDSAMTGYAIVNIRTRLQACYGDRHRFEIDSVPGSGTTIRLLLPPRTLMSERKGYGETADR